MSHFQTLATRTQQTLSFIIVAGIGIYDST